MFVGTMACLHVCCMVCSAAYTCGICSASKLIPVKSQSVHSQCTRTRLARSVLYSVACLGMFTMTSQQL